MRARGREIMDLVPLLRQPAPGETVVDGRFFMAFGGKGANQLTSQRLTDQGQTCAFHCNRVAVKTYSERK